MIAIAETLTEAAVMPILTVKDMETTLSTVAALVEGGVRAVEIVLRTPQAAEAIGLVRQAHPALLTAAGTILGPDSFDRAVQAGAQLIISPGLTPALIAHHRANPFPMVPGAMTASEVMAAADAGYNVLKYYPAVPSNGVAILADYHYLFPQVLFMPTGKIGLEVLSDFAGLANVAAIGGSWMHSGPIVDIPEKVRRSLNLIAEARQSRGRDR